MESQPQNPEFRNNPENFHPWVKILFNILSLFRKMSVIPDAINVKFHYVSFLHILINNFINKIPKFLTNKECMCTSES